MGYEGPRFQRNRSHVGEAPSIFLGALYGFPAALAVAIALATATHVGRGVLLGVPCAVWALCILVGVIVRLRRS